MAKTNKELNEEFIKEFNLVFDNAEKLVVGQKYKYADLMTILGLPIKKDGKCKTTQIKRIQSYIQWDSKTKIFDGIIEDAIPILKKTNTSEYYDSIKDCTIFNLQQYIDKNPTQGYLYLSYDRTLFYCDIVSEGFLLTKNNKASEIASGLIGVTSDFLIRYREQFRTDAIKIVDKAFENMQSDGLLSYEKCVMFVEFQRDEFNNVIININDSECKLLKKASHRKAEMYEVEALNKCKHIVLEQMLPHVEPNKRIFVLKNTDRYKHYRENVMELMRSEFNIDIDSFYNAYEIDLTKVNMKYDADYFNERSNLKLKFKAKMKKCNNVNYRKALETVMRQKEGEFGVDIEDAIIEVNKMIIDDSEVNEKLRVEVYTYELEKYKNKISAKLKEVKRTKTKTDDKTNDELNSLKQQITMLTEAIKRKEVTKA